MCFLKVSNTTLLINLAVGSTCLHIIYWLHKPWCCHKECRISHPSSCWNDLTTTSVQRLRCNLRINYFELNISYRFIAKWTFSGTPLESAQNNPLLKSQKLYQWSRQGDNEVYPCTIESLTAFSNVLSTSLERVSSNRMLGPYINYICQIIQGNTNLGHGKQYPRLKNTLFSKKKERRLKNTLRSGQEKTMRLMHNFVEYCNYGY